MMTAESMLSKRSVLRITGAVVLIFLLEINYIIVIMQKRKITDKIDPTLPA